MLLSEAILSFLSKVFLIAVKTQNVPKVQLLDIKC